MVKMMRVTNRFVVLAASFNLLCFFFNEKYQNLLSLYTAEISSIWRI